MAHVLLKDIVDIVMEFSEDPDNYLNGVSRALVISRAKRLLQEVNYAGLKNLSLFEAEISASGKVVFPDDYVEYVKIYYCVGNYLMPAFFNNHINTLQWDNLKETEEMFITSATGKKILTESNDYITVDVKTDEKVKDYGHIKNMCFLKGYKIDRKNNAIVFDYIPCGITHVAILYVSDPLVQEPDISELGIHKYFQKALEAGIYSYIIEQRRNVPMNEKIRAKKEWLIKYKDAVNELNAKPYELLQALAGWKHMRKQCYPGMGGQEIPQKKEEKYLYSLEYTDFVCQLGTDEKEKEIDNISFSTKSSTTKVTVFVDAEKAVYSDVKLRFYPVVSARSAQLQDVYYVLKKGEKSGSFVIDSDFYGKNTDASILSVANVTNSNEDDTYIYKVENDVFVPDLKDKNRVPIYIDAFVENGEIKITCSGDVTSDVILTITSDTDPSYTSSIVLSPMDKVVTDELRSEFAGHSAFVQLYSVDGVIGMDNDDYSVYSAPEFVFIPDIPKKTINTIVVESELDIWRAYWNARSQYPVSSQIQVLSNRGEVAPEREVIIKKGDDLSNVMPVYETDFGKTGHLSISPQEDENYIYQLSSETIDFVTPDSLQQNDWNVSFEIRDNGGIYPVITFEKPLTSDVNFCFSIKAHDYGSAIILVDMKAGDVSARAAHAAMNGYQGEEVKIFVFAVADKQEPSTTVPQAWDLEQVFPHIKMVSIPSLAVKAKTKGESLNFTANVDEALVFWGDGNIEHSSGSFNHTYTDGAESHDISIFSFGGFKNIYCYSCELTNLEVHNAEEIYCRDNPELTSLNIIGGEKLRDLNCEDCDIQSLDVSNFPILEYLFLNGNSSLTQLDVSKNAELLKLSCGDTKITSLDVSGCPRIYDIAIWPNVPLVSNQEGLLTLVSSLPDRARLEAGKLLMYDSTAAELIQDICSAKNWTIE